MTEIYILVHRDEDGNEEVLQFYNSLERAEKECEHFNQFLTDGESKYLVIVEEVQTE